MLDALYHAIDPVAFSLGPFDVRWYGLAYVLGFCLAGLIIWRVSKHWKLGMTTDDVFSVITCVVVGVILGARLGYVIFYGNGYYVQHPLEILAFNQGGMSFHGGLIGCVLGGAVAARITRVPFGTLCDLGAIAGSIGLFFGRCANFINGELWGAEAPNLPWAVVFGGAAGSVPRHPSQLYEAVLEGIVIFLVLYALSRRVPPRPRGTFLGTFLVLYGVFRFCIEFVRQPDAQLGYLAGGWLTMGMVLSAPLVLAGAALLAWAHIKHLPQSGPCNPDERRKHMAKFYRNGNVVVLGAYGTPTEGELIEPNTTDGAREKHVPVVQRDGAVVRVAVGDVAHPMTEEHYITFIALETTSGVQMAYLTPESEPVAEFTLGEGIEPVAAYEYCNLHGLWKAEL